MLFLRLEIRFFFTKILMCEAIDLSNFPLIELPRSRIYQKISV